MDRYSGFCNIAAYGSVRPPDLCLVQTASGTERCVKGLDASGPDFAPGDNWLVFAAPITGQPEIGKAGLSIMIVNNLRFICGFASVTRMRLS